MTRSQWGVRATRAAEAAAREAIARAPRDVWLRAGTGLRDPYPCTCRPDARCDGQPDEQGHLWCRCVGRPDRAAARCCAGRIVWRG